MAAETTRMTCLLTDDAIVIRLSLNVVSVALSAAPFNGNDRCEPVYGVTDLRAFADAIVDQLTREEEDGATMLHVLFDAAMQLAIDDGAEGVEEIKYTPEVRDGE